MRPRGSLRPLLTRPPPAGRPEAGRPKAGQPNASTRRAAAWAAGLTGLILYNWWALVPLKPGLMRSPDEFFSNLEVAGQPYASLMAHADVASGLLVLAAFL